MSNDKKREDSSSFDSEEWVDGEPPIEAFKEEEGEKPSSKRKRVLFGVIAVIVAGAMLVNVGSFFFQHFSLDALDFMRESEELTADGGFEEYEQAVVRIQSSAGHGTGFAVSEDGFVVTNDHVIGESLSPVITFPSGESYASELVKRDENKDLALLSIEEAENVPHLALGEEQPEEGAEIFVIGHPLTHSYIVNSGHIKETTAQFEVLTISNEIFPGHSGSPVLSTEGEVVGVVYARRTEGTEAGSGLAVPIDEVQAFLDSNEPDV
ncbi:S1 family peptidase [Shouchella shacheensis]|uniref:S1 family peptidase n=1 Tax=Shouchella shacheensis TaxID=1649580 RepID=UPI00073FBAB8|nr:serine protease [Shouchella shacheensis]